MAKDPAFLFFPNDWLGGTMYLTRHQKGCYIDLLIAQFNNGPLSLDTIKTVLGQDQANWTVLSSKFKQTAEGLWYNERLVTEIEKRKSFCESRRNNIQSRYNKKESTHEDTSVTHTYIRMENGNGIRDRNNKRGSKGKKFSAPSLDEFKAYFKENGFREDIAERAWNGYSEANWHDSQGKEIKIWKQKCQHVWFKDEHKIKDTPHQTSTRQKFLKKAVQILPDSLCVIFEDNFSGRCTPQEAMDFKAGKIELSYFNREF